MSEAMLNVGEELFILLARSVCKVDFIFTYEYMDPHDSHMSIEPNNWDPMIEVRKMQVQVLVII